MEVCENCGRNIGKLETAHIHDDHIVCSECVSRLRMTDIQQIPSPIVPVERKTQIVAVAPPVVRPYSGPVCQLCGGELKKTSTGTDPVLHLFAALILFCFGIFLIIIFPVIGWLIGGTLVVYSLVKGSGYKKIFKCRNCGAIADRK